MLSNRVTICCVKAGAKGTTAEMDLVFRYSKMGNYPSCRQNAPTRLELCMSRRCTRSEVSPFSCYRMAMATVVMYRHAWTHSLVRSGTLVAWLSWMLS